MSYIFFATSPNCTTTLPCLQATHARPGHSSAVPAATCHHDPMDSGHILALPPPTHHEIDIAEMAAAEARVAQRAHYMSSRTTAAGLIARISPVGYCNAMPRLRVM